jgi:hypothetical protein
MCTVVLQSAGAGQLLFAGNRDELRTRQRALPPREHRQHNYLSAIWPQDADGGGTWVGVNTAGMVATLLNNYPADAARQAPADPLSRGVLVPRVLALLNWDQVYESSLRWEDVERFRPFELVVANAALDTTASGLRMMWDGAELRMWGVDFPSALTSSGVDAVAVEASRRGALASLLESGADWSRERVDAVFGGHVPERGASSVCMHRDDASTVSHTRIEVTPSHVALTYYDGPLCESPEGVRVELARTPSRW